MVNCTRRAARETPRLFICGRPLGRGVLLLCLGSLSLQAFTSLSYPVWFNSRRPHHESTLFLKAKVVSVPNEKNLIPMDQRSEEEARELGRQGGRASGAARRRKRALKEAADLYLSLPVFDRRKWNALARRGVDPEDIDNQMAVIIGLTDAAASGDARAGRLLVDILGEDSRADPAADQLDKAAQLLGGIDSVIK